MKQFSFCMVILAIALVAIAVSQEAQQKRTQAEILDAVSFDKVVLTTLIALEQNYQVRKRLIPLVHEDDYYAVILNTAKRIALADDKKKVSTVIPAKQDTTDTK